MHWHLRIRKLNHNTFIKKDNSTSVLEKNDKNFEGQKTSDKTILNILGNPILLGWQII